MDDMSPDEQIENLKLHLMEMQRQRDDWRKLHDREVMHRSDWEDRYMRMLAERDAARAQNRAS